MSAYHQQGYRPGVYNVTWDLAVDEAGHLHIATRRESHGSGQIKQVHRWFRNLNQTYTRHRCKDLRRLQLKAQNTGHYRLPAAE